jgi:hypothetical protein
MAGKPRTATEEVLRKERREAFMGAIKSESAQGRMD